MSLSSITNNAMGYIGQLSGKQQEMLANAPPEMQGMLKAQMEMQKEQELVQFITQMMKQMHEMAMSVIRNIGG